MEPLDILLIIAVGFVAGFVNTVAGGGSLLTLPILIFLGLPPAIANASNRVAIFLQNIFGIMGFRSKGVSAFPFSLYLGIIALFGAIIGAKISVELDEALFNRVIAIVMVMVLLLIIFNPIKTTSGEERMDLKRQIISYVLFFFIGIYGGFIQAGTGFLVIAVLNGLNHFSLAKTNSAKVMVIMTFNVAALAVFLYEDVINWQYGLTLAIGNSSGAWVSSRWSVKVGDVWVKRFLIVMVSILAVRLWFF